MNDLEAIRPRPLPRKGFLLLWLAAFLWLAAPAPQVFAQAVVYDSTTTATSTYEPSCTTGNYDKVIDLPSDGIIEDGTVIIATPCNISFTPVGNGTSPVIWLVAGDVTIDGWISVNGSAGSPKDLAVGGLGGLGGPGGSDGGMGGSVSASDGLVRTSQRGYGLGGGSPGCCSGGAGGIDIDRTDAYEQPLVGGGGGAGGNAATSGDYGGGGGGGGAGAIWIVAGGTVTVNGSITAVGGAGGSGYYGGGSGGKGTVHITATGIAGAGSINASYIILETVDPSTIPSSLTGSVTIDKIHLRELAWTQPTDSYTLDILSIDDGTTVHNISNPSATVTLASDGPVDVQVYSADLPETTQVKIYVQGRSSSNVTVALDFDGYATGTVSVPAGTNAIHAVVLSPP